MRQDSRQIVDRGINRQAAVRPLDGAAQIGAHLWVAQVCGVHLDEPALQRNIRSQTRLARQQAVRLGLPDGETPAIGGQRQRAILWRAAEGGIRRQAATVSATKGAQIAEAHPGAQIMARRVDLALR